VWNVYSSFKLVQNLTNGQNTEGEKIVKRQNKLQILTTKPYKLEIMPEEEIIQRPTLQKSALWYCYLTTKISRYQESSQHSPQHTQETSSTVSVPRNRPQILPPSGPSLSLCYSYHPNIHQKFIKTT
jgi:hypothetical protein